MATYLPVAKASFGFTTFPNPRPLLTDGDDVTSRSGTIASGIGVVKRGTIVNIVPSTGVITVPTTLAGCNAVLADDVDATSATAGAIVYLSARVAADALIWPAALNHGDVTDALRNCDIIVESVVNFDGTTAKSAPTEAETAEAKKRLEAARKALADAEKAQGKGEKEGEKGPLPSDSLWPYLTPEEREKHPELASASAVPPESEEHGHRGEHEHHAGNNPKATPPTAPPKK